jgi:lipopolysaccharide assembly outer membrane protein LptD (OstA)
MCRRRRLNPCQMRQAPTPAEGEATPPPPASPESPTPASTTPFGAAGVIELTADRQEYDEQRQVITAQGNVVLRFREAILDADRVQVNLPNRILIAEGNVALTRGEQVLRGERFEYYFVQDSGVVLNASGEFYTPTSGTDLNVLPAPDGTAVYTSRSDH